MQHMGSQSVHPSWFAVQANWRISQQSDHRQRVDFADRSLEMNFSERREERGDHKHHWPLFWNGMEIARKSISQLT